MQFRSVLAAENTVFGLSNGGARIVHGGGRKKLSTSL